MRLTCRRQAERYEGYCEKMRPTGDIDVYTAEVSLSIAALTRSKPLSLNSGMRSSAALACELSLVVPPPPQYDQHHA
jgi:hypothetical protein